MFSSLALETMDSVSPELTWKPFTKGRRSRKSVARNFDGPKGVIDTFVSGSNKVCGPGRGHSTSRWKEKVIKNEGRKVDSPPAFSEGNEQPLCPCYSSEDLCGIELLATVAIMDDDFMKAGCEVLPENSLVPRCSDAAATFTSQPKELPKPNELAASSETLCRSPNENNMQKVNRNHWDLNTLMDAWVEPFDSNANGMPFEEKHKDSEDQITGDDVDVKSTNQVLGRDSCLETEKQVKMTEATIDGSLVHKLDCSELSMQVEQLVESSNMISCPDTLAFDKAHRNTQDVVCDPSAIEVSESVIVVQCSDSKGCVMASGGSHTTISMDNATPSTFRSHSDADENNSNEVKHILIPKQVDNNETSDELKGIIMSGVRAQCIDPSAVETNDLLVADSPHYVQEHVVGDDLTRHLEMYDSSYEDGELRGSFLYSWEDKSPENESIGYESDGRNVDGSSANDHAGCDIILEGVTHSLRHLVNDDPESNEVSGKGESNAGSGTTVEHSLELIIEENDNCTKRRKLSGRRDLFAGKSRDADGYQLKFAARRSYIDSRMNPYSIQRFRSRCYNSSVPRTQREVTPARYQGRRRPISYNERDKVDQWAHWDSKKHFTPRYEADFDRFGDSDHRKTTSNISIGLQKPFTRKRKADDSLGIHTRTPPFGQGSSRYKSRGYYPQCGGRDFGEYFEPPLENNATRVTRLTRYSSKRERSFSPNPGAVACFNKHLRDQSSYTMKHSRSQDFGYNKIRTGRLRGVPSSKSALASQHEDNYSSPSHRRFSPVLRGQIGTPDENIRHRRSHLNRTRKFDAAGFVSGGVKDVHYPLRRSSFKPNRGREASSTDYGCGANGEVNHRVNGGIVRSLRGSLNTNDK